MARKSPKVMMVGDDAVAVEKKAKRVRKRVSLPPAVEQALLIQSKLDALIAAIPETGYDAVVDILCQVPIMLAREMAMAIAGVPEAAVATWPADVPARDPAATSPMNGTNGRPSLPTPEGKQRYSRAKTRDGRTWTLRGNPNGDATGFLEGHHPRPDSVPVDEWITDAGDYQWIIDNVPDPMEAALADGLAFANGQ